MLDQSAAQLQEIIAVTPPPFRTGLGWFVLPLMQFIPCVAETLSTYSTLSSHLGTARLSLHSIWSFPLFSPGRTGSSQPLVHTWQKLEKDIYIWYMLPPPKTHCAEDSDAYWCVKEPLFGKNDSFRNDIKPSFNHTPDSYTIFSVWSTFNIAVEKCNSRCKLLHSWKTNIVVKGTWCLQVTICFDYISSSKKQYFCRTIQYVEKCDIYIYTTFNEAQPSYYVSCMRTFSGKTLLLQNKCPEDKVFP